MAKVCKKATVTGKVQGVFYRKSTQQYAQARNLRGYAKNLSDGSVEVLACGDEGAVDELLAWLWTGPEASEVVSVAVTDIKMQIPQGFEVM